MFCYIDSAAQHRKQKNELIINLQRQVQTLSQRLSKYEAVDKGGEDSTSPAVFPFASTSSSSTSFVSSSFPFSQAKFVASLYNTDSAEEIILRLLATTPPPNNPLTLQ